MYITWKKILEIGPTPDRRGCSADSRYHKKDCVERFIAHFGEDEPDTHVTELPEPPNISTSSSSTALISSTKQNFLEDSTQEHGCSERRINGEPNPNNNHSQPPNTAVAHATIGAPSSSTFCTECFERSPACTCGVTSTKHSPCVDPSTSPAAHAANDGPSNSNKNTANGTRNKKKGEEVATEPSLQNRLLQNHHKAS